MVGTELRWVWNKTEISDYSYNYFSNKSDPITIDSIAPDDVSDNSASLEASHVDFLMLEMNHSLNLCRKKKEKKMVTSHKVYI